MKEWMMVFEPSDVMAWALVALPVGLFVTQFMAGRGYGIAGDLGVAAAGALIGGVAVSWLGFEGQAGWLASMLATVVGAVLLTRLARSVPGRSPA
jgi:uncharacterized membrane protein YeaQ/YmgE (transglycosylase-associated protein family)